MSSLPVPVSPWISTVTSLVSSSRRVPTPRAWRRCARGCLRSTRGRRTSSAGRGLAAARPPARHLEPAHAPPEGGAVEGERTDGSEGSAIERLRQHDEALDACARRAREQDGHRVGADARGAREQPPPVGRADQLVGDDDVRVDVGEHAGGVVLAGDGGLGQLAERRESVAHLCVDRIRAEEHDGATQGARDLSVRGEQRPVHRLEPN